MSRCLYIFFNENYDNKFHYFYRIETIDGSAVEGEDYEPLNEILTFEPNEREKEVCYLMTSQYGLFVIL